MKQSTLLESLQSQPWLLHVIFGAGLLSHLVGRRQVLDFHLQGWMWALILAVSSMVLVQRLGRIALPWLFWLPWAVWVLWGVFSDYEYAVQSTAQILCPLVAGAAVSTLTFQPDAIRLSTAYIEKVFQGFLLVFAVFVLPWTLRDIEHSGFAAGAINSLFFQSFFLCAWLLQGRKWRHLWMYLAAAAVPLIGGNRGPLLAGFGLVLFVVAPLSLRLRTLIALTGVALGLAAFHTPKVQNKMFHSGQGTLRDLRWENPDLNTSGRKPMWDAMNQGIAERPWLGHGGNADRTFLLGNGFPQYLPHNDWLRVRYNYGNLGALLYAATMLLQMAHAYHRSRFASPPVRLLFCAAATCFIPYMIVMNTDNVLIYCQFFTVPHFALLGYAYAAQEQHAEAADVVRLVLRPVAACDGEASVLRTSTETDS